jgi:hypothetical protein
MRKTGEKGFFGSHAKSSALAVSLVLHAILIVGAVSFVAVKIIVKEDAGFEAKQVNRPKMPLKKLQVPVKVKPRTKPRLRKQIMVKQRMSRKMPEIKMPEMAGVKGGMGGAVASAGAGMGGVGFSMPEINIFGLKSRGEKIFIILDADAEMMFDEMGGIAAYALIKNELLRIVDELPSTVLFNVAVFQRGNRSKVLFPSLVNVSEKNVEALKQWLDPLNAVSADMGDRDYGVKTLGPGGAMIDGDLKVEPIESYGFWVNPALLSMKQQADSVYLLTCRWGNLNHRLEITKGSDAEIRKWEKLYERARKKLEKDNEMRRKNGQPPRVLGGKISIVKAYFPDARAPSGSTRFFYTPKVMGQAMDTVRKEHVSALPATSGLSKRRAGRYSVNVVHFVPRGGDANEKSGGNLKQFASLCHGKYRKLAGLEAIQSSIAKEKAGK